MKIIDADKLHYKQVYIQTEKGLRPALVVFAKEIRKMPEIPQLKVQVDPVMHGHWIFNPKDAIEMMFTLPKCSECGAESSDGGNYCSNCGARMDGVEDETC